ncbi:MAG TPA: hypothetical protein DCG12_05550 [Planctomycetaceae bacterium]|nr:hypothetical protein [Planctomycetaceae bacterium]
MTPQPCGRINLFGRIEPLYGRRRAIRGDRIPEPPKFIFENQIEAAHAYIKRMERQKAAKKRPEQNAGESAPGR